MANKKTIHIIIVSMIVFFCLNFIENIIHFSIGRNIEDKDTSSISIKIPNIYDTLKILGIMILFSILQGVFTYLFDEIL